MTKSWQGQHPHQLLSEFVYPMYFAGFRRLRCCRRLLISIHPLSMRDIKFPTAGTTEEAQA